MFNSILIQAVEQFASLTHTIPDAGLAKPWAWQSYDGEGIRFAFFRTYEELRELAVKLKSERLSQGIPITAAQCILAQYDAAYWDLQAALLGVADAQLDQPPAEGEWPVRQVLAHIFQADLSFYVAVRYALDQYRAGVQEPPRVTREMWVAISGIDKASFQSITEGPFAALRDHHAAVHERIVREFSSMSDAELATASKYWENEAMSLRFRLHRFDSHMRQHTIQMDKTTIAIQGQPNEAKRLNRLIYAALADVNSALIGAWDLGESSRAELAQAIRARAEEIATQ
jgi:uncharacterized damage-inducible protein DinB